MCSCFSCILFAVIQQKITKKECCLKLCKDDDGFSWYEALKCSNGMPSIDIDILLPYY